MKNMFNSFFKIITLVLLMVFSCAKSNVISGSGTIEIIEINVSTKNSDELKALYAGEGDIVKKGQVIAEINHTILDLQLVQAMSNFRNAEMNFNRIKDIFESGNAALKDRDDAENRFVVSRSSYEIIKKQIDDCSIKAPCDGIITHKFAEEGEFITIGSPVYSISKIDPVNLTIYITETELGSVKTGQKAEINIDSTQKRKFEGKVIYISPNAEFTPKNIQTKDERVMQVFGVKLEIPNPLGILKPGMPADAVIIK